MSTTSVPPPPPPPVSILLVKRPYTTVSTNSLQLEREHHLEWLDYAEQNRQQAEQLGAGRHDDCLHATWRQTSRTGACAFCEADSDMQRDDYSVDRRVHGTLRPAHHTMIFGRVVPINIVERRLYPAQHVARSVRAVLVDGKSV